MINVQKYWFQRYKVRAGYFQLRGLGGRLGSGKEVGGARPLERPFSAVATLLVATKTKKARSVSSLPPRFAHAP